MTPEEHHLLVDELYERRRRAAAKYTQVAKATKELDAMRAELDTFEQLEKAAASLLAEAAVEPQRVRAAQRDSRHYEFRGSGGEVLVPIVRAFVTATDGVAVPGGVSRDPSR